MQPSCKQKKGQEALTHNLQTKIYTQPGNTWEVFQPQ